MKLTRAYLLLMLLLPLVSGLAGCAGSQTFGTAARAGDTVALPVGWLNLKRQNLTVTITPASGPAVQNVPVRAVVNLYPDPSSKLMVGFRTKQDLGGAWGVGSQINSNVTSQDREWWQSTVLLDLPASLPEGTATIQIADSAGANIQPISVIVLPGVGSQDLFNIYDPNGGGPFPLLAENYYPQDLTSMETADRYAVRFGGHDSNGNDLIPHSIQLQFTHTPGVGVPCVIDPVPYLKSTVWSDDGNGTLTVMVTPSGGTTLKQTSGGTGLLQFKFYIAGGIAGPGLSQPVIKAYDVNGNPMLGITATVTPQ